MAETLKPSSCLIRFLPDGAEISVPPGTDILEAALEAGIYINSSCAGEGICGRCRVIVKNGSIETEPSGRLSREEVKTGYVLACRSTVHSDAEIEIPASSRLEGQQAVSEETKAERLAGVFTPGEEIERGPEPEERRIFKHSPLATKLFLKLQPPTLDNNISDLERLYHAVRKVTDTTHLQTGLANVRKFGRIFRESNWEITALLGKRNGTVEIVSVEPGDTSSKNFGIACDIGTTTISIELVDLTTGRTLSRKAAYNKQASYGEDVITRMIFARKEEGLEKLHHLVIDTVNSMIDSMAVETGTHLNEITAVMCAGNTTMIHLLLRVDPSYIRREPYVPTADFMPVIRAAEAGIKVNPRGLLACVPGVSSYVGGDITAGVLASGIEEEENISLFIDIGTNGEIVMGNREWLSCCSSSAGPAFEGSGVSCGVRAMRGAIQGVSIDSSLEVHYSTIGDDKPIGICGSGYVECLAELLTSGLVDRSGAFAGGAACRRLRSGEYGREFILAFADEAACDYDIVINQVDINNLLRSKGAVYAAQRVLIDRMGLSGEDMNRVYLSGGFGNYINVEKAIIIGLLPDLPRDRFRFLGNASLAGAKYSLLSYEALERARGLAKKMTNIELSVDPEFMNEFTASVFLPHTDAERFPTVRLNKH